MKMPRADRRWPQTNRGCIFVLRSVVLRRATNSKEQLLARTDGLIRMS
jgi:hypothetical protein